MHEIDTSDFQIDLDCPFCGAKIVTAYDFSLILDDMLVEDREEITCNGQGDDYVSSPCEHLAFFSDRAYAGHSITPKWKKEVAALAAALSEESTTLSDDDIGDILCVTSEEEIDQLMKKTPGKYQHAFLEKYIEKFD